MLFQLNPASGEPLYEQLEDMIAKYICLGALEPHEKLPSVRAMAGELGINPNTVAKAYRFLESENIIYTIPGKGVFVADSRAAQDFFLKKSLSEFRRAVSKAKLAGVSEQTLIQTLQESLKGGTEND